MENHTEGVIHAIFLQANEYKGCNWLKKILLIDTVSHQIQPCSSRTWVTRNLSVLTSRGSLSSVKVTFSSKNQVFDYFSYYNWTKLKHLLRTKIFLKFVHNKIVKHDKKVLPSNLQTRALSNSSWQLTLESIFIPQIFRVEDGKDIIKRILTSIHQPSFDTHWQTRGFSGTFEHHWPEIKMTFLEKQSR